MKWILLLIICLSPQLLCAQQQDATSRKTYALVVGIANYAARGIPKLKYANRDAEVFANFLQTAAGGNVPKENITVLLDSNATTAAVYAAMSMLRQSAGKDDLVYFYFAGHGDMENETIYKLGFLLTYNTPRTNYINNAIRIEDLNNFANTLSINNKAKVVLITDACHSGELAGNQFKGNFLVGEQLRTVRSKEIRITSCANDELAMEDERWGGGRGVFSFYLINGLSGLADDKADGFVTLAEIRNFLATSFSKDPLLKEVQHKQTPIVQGTDEFPLALKTSDSNLLSPPVLTMGGEAQTAVNRSSEDLVEDVFKFPELATFESVLKFDSLLNIPAEEIPAAAIANWQQMLYKDTLAGNAHKTLKQLATLEQLQNAIHQSEALRTTFNRRLVIQIHDRAQEVINLALEGDVAELERRRYYNAAASGYEAYPQMLALALQLTDKEDYLYRVLQVNKFYFSGLAVQIKIPTVANPAPLVAAAMNSTLQALELEKNAAYIYNQLGSLQLLNNQFAAAEKQFLKAIEISPQWAIPWSNLVGLYAITNQYKQADSAFRKAVALQPNLQNSFANAGSIYEMKGDLLFAEELQRKSIALNSRHYFPFERLANIYLKTTNYASADSFYFEATIRKQGYYFSPLASRVLLPVFQFSETEKLPCVFDSMLVSQADVPGNFAWALHSYKRGDLATAEQKLKLVIALDQKHPLAFHYLGKLLSEQKRWQEAAIILEYATEYFADSIAFNHYLNSLSRQLSASTQSDCLLQTLRDAYYPPQHNHYLLGNLYENWQYFSEAETNFRTVIELEPYFMGGYYRLWTMQEKLGRYVDAEKTIQHFASINPMDGLNELNSFYKRVTQRFPADGYWFYKAGQFCYDIAAGKASNFIYDLKTVLPDDTIASFETKIRVAATSRALVIGVLRESIQTASPILSPMSHGIRYLTTADSLLALDDNAIADINGKIADLLFWQGLPQESALRYEKAIALQRHNASIRSKMVGAYTTTFQNRNALQQLEFLKSNHELNFHQQILLAQLYLHAGRFAEADTLVNNSKQIHPYAKPEFVLIPAKRFLMSKQFAKAVKQYLNYLKDTPTDANAMYSVARSYARMSRNRDAWDWLQRAVQNGFGYAYVLENDECWNKMRKAHRWKEFMSRQKFVAYSVPETSMKPD